MKFDTVSDTVSGFRSEGTPLFSEGVGKKLLTPSVENLLGPNSFGVETTLPALDVECDSIAFHVGGLLMTPKLENISGSRAPT